MSTFGTRLKKLRLDHPHNPTQQDVADAIGYTRATYANWEINRGQPDHEAMRQLSTYFKCTTDYLLGITDKPDVMLITPKLATLTGEEKEFVEQEKPLVRLVAELIGRDIPEEEIKELIRIAMDVKKTLL